MLEIIRLCCQLHSLMPQLAGTAAAAAAGILSKLARDLQSFTRTPVFNPWTPAAAAAAAAAGEAMCTVFVLTAAAATVATLCL
jgi:hypothetical protein